MKYLKHLGFAMAACAVLLMSCGGEEPEPNPNPNPGGGDNPGGEETGQYTPAESKRFLEQSALDVLEYFNTDDQKELLVVGNYFMENFADLGFPEFDVRKCPAKSFMQSLLRGAAGLNPSALSRAAKSYVYSLDFAEFSGIYQPGKYEWVRVGDSSDIILRFNDGSGNACELKAVASKNENDQIEFSFEEWDDYEYNPATGYYEDIYADVTVKARVPKTVTVTMTKGGKELVNVKVNTTIDIKGHKLNATVDGKVMNITVNATTDGTDTRITETSSAAVNGKTLVTTSATVNGRHLCDKANWERVANDEDGDYTIEDFLTNAQGQADVMGKVQVYANISEITDDMAEAIYGYWDKYDCTEAEAKAEAEKSANLLNKKVKTVVKYNGTSTEQAQIRWQTARYGDSYGYYDWWEYCIEPVLYFPADGTTYEFENYFEKGFQNVVTSVEDLIDSYCEFWD